MSGDTGGQLILPLSAGLSRFDSERDRVMGIDSSNSQKLTGRLGLGYPRLRHVDRNAHNALMETCSSAPCFGGPELPTDGDCDGHDWQSRRHGFRDSTPVRQKLSLPAAGCAALRAARTRPDLDARHDDV